MEGTPGRASKIRGMREKSLNPLVAIGEKDMAPATSSDRGERQRDCYGDMLRSVADWHWETEQELNLIQVSPGLTAALGRPGESLLGHSLFDLIDPADGSLRTVTAAVRQRRPFRVEALRLADSTGAQSCRLTGLPYYEAASGRFAGYRGTGTAAETAGGKKDSSARMLKILEAALARKDELEWQLSEGSDQVLKSRLAAIAHELRTPLNAILGFAEALKDGHLGIDAERQRDCARNIHESGRHLTAVIDSLFGEVPREEQEPKVDVAEVTASALRMLEPRAEAAGIKVINALPSHLPPARGEVHVLRQILLNLLTNAIKYTPKGGSVGVEAKIEQPDLLRVMIWDTGVGIAPEEHERVFQHAYRAPQSGKEQPGSGLGLAISRNLAQGLGGDIEISSMPNQGTRVSLRLLPAQDL